MRQRGRRPAAPARRATGAAAREAAEPPSRIAVPAAIVSVAALAAIGHLVFLVSAGGLWRDEANTVAFARMPSLAELWRNFPYDSVPLASTLLVRGWIGLGLSFDIALRVLGGLIGAAVLGALFLSARITRATLPLCSAVLVALNVWVIRGGDAIRPSGLGMLFAVLAFGALAAALERPSPRRAALAVLAAVLSVQSLYANLPLIAGMAAGALVVAWTTRSRARALVGIAVPLAAALSLLPYRAAIQSARAWSELVQIGGDPAQALASFREASAPDGILWAVFLLAALLLAVQAVRRRTPRGAAAAPDFGREFALFAGTTLVAASVLLAAFFAWSRLELQPWYFLPWMALAGACADVTFGPSVRSARLRAAILLMAVAAAASHLLMGWGTLRLRQSNVDLIAAQLGAEARPGDLVIVSPWYLAIPFHRYYTGAAPWQTVPRLSDTRVHRIDLMKQAMERPEIIDASVAAVDSTLRRGGTVWMVGGLPRVAPGVSYRRAPVAPAPGIGWSLRSYTAIWSSIVLDSVRGHAVSFDPVPVYSERAIQPREQEALFKATGWR